MSELNVGDPAPDFVMPSDTHGDIQLSAFAGKNIVLYFYPKDSTPGCTNEAIDFSAHIGRFNEANTVVIGVSRDSIKRHENFREKNDLKVILGADLDGKVTEDYGVWVEKSMYGKKYMGIERATFLISASGEISHIWRKVKVKGHAEDVLEKVRSLTS